MAGVKNPGSEMPGVVLYSGLGKDVAKNLFACFVWDPCCECR